MQRASLVAKLVAGGREAVSLIYADDANLDIARELGHLAVDHDNRPLAVKCSAGLRHAARLADFVVWVGSDDWIHPDVFDSLPTRRTHDGTIHTGTRLAAVNLERGTLTRVASPAFEYGAIPWLIDSRLMRDTRHPLIRPDLESGLDGALIRGIRLNRRLPMSFVWHDPHDLRCVDFKTTENLTPYDLFTSRHGTAPEEEAWPALAKRYPLALVEQARRLSEETRCPN